MDCKTFNENIDNFINDNMSETELEEFILHFESCKNCKEEMEIYFMIHRMFDPEIESEYSNYNLSDILNKYISVKKESIINYYKIKYFNTMMYMIGNGISVLSLIYFIYYLINR